MDKSITLAFGTGNGQQESTTLYIHTYWFVRGNRTINHYRTEQFTYSNIFILTSAVMAEVSNIMKVVVIKPLALLVVAEETNKRCGNGYSCGRRKAAMVVIQVVKEHPMRYAL